MGLNTVPTSPSAPADDSWKDDPWLGVFPPTLSRERDPYALLARLRSHDPVNETPIGLFRLTRYDDVVRMLKEVPSGVRFADGTLFGAVATTGGIDEFILRQDPPAHTRLRKLMSQAFKPRAMDRLRARVQELCDELIDGVIERGELDVIRDLALPVPSTVICEMMGVPLADRPMFTELTSRTTHLLAAALLPPDAVASAIGAAEELAAYFQALIEDRRGHLGEDILSELIRAEEEGDRLSQTELLSQSIGLLIAGFETTIGLIGNGVRALVEHRDQLDLLQEDPNLIASTVEECLRYDGPILLTIRFTREDTAFGDRIIPKDRPVMCMLAGANHDPAHFADPERFDIRRTDNDHLAFGGGAHFCLGVHLARMETQAAIGTLVRRLRDLEMTSDELQWGQSLFRVLGSLPLAFRPR